MNRSSGWIGRHPARALLLVLVVTALALPWTLRLRLDSSVLGLLPTGSPAARDLRVVEELFGDLERVYVAVRAATETVGDGPRLAEAAGLIALDLLAAPEVVSARAGIEAADETDWLERVASRAPLLLGEDWEAELERRTEPTAMARRVEEIRNLLLSPHGPAMRDLLVHDPLGFSEAAGLLPASAVGVPIDPWSGGFVAGDGSAALVLLRVAQKELDPAAAARLETAIRAACRRAGEYLETALRCDAAGGPLYAVHDIRLLRRDLVRTVWTSALLCALVLVFSLDGVVAPLVVLASLVPALAWTGAAAHLLLDPITAVAVGFAAVLIGLGVDYGIHTVVRYREARLAGAAPAAAWQVTVRGAGPGILTSALTTAAGFSVLLAASVPPLRDLGGAVSVGILCTLLATWLTAGGLLVLLGRRRAFTRSPGRGWRALGRFVDGATRLGTARPGLVLALVLLSLPLAAWGARQLHLEADLRSLRPEDHPLAAAEELLADRFGLGLDTATVAVPAATASAALARARELAAELRRELGPEVSVVTEADWTLGAEARRARLERLAGLGLGAAANQLERELERAGLAPSAFAPGLDALRDLAAGRDPGAGDGPDGDAPRWGSRSSDEGVRTVGETTWVAVRLQLPIERWPAGPPARLLERIREVAPGAAVASAARFGEEIKRSARSDLVKLGALALVVVLGVVLASFRGRAGDGFLALVPVGLGVLWTFGLLGALRLPLDLISLALLPILLGIGVDDGLHAVHGRRLEPKAGFPGSVRAAGRAMTLTSLTTCAAFGSLTLSRFPGLRGGGVAVVAGVAACLLATLVVLPAIGAIQARDSKPPSPDPPVDSNDGP